MDYTDILDRALSHLRELETDKALTLFYQLLEEHPKDLDLINRIYPLELNKPDENGFKRLSSHIFGIRSSKTEYHRLIIKTYGDYKKKVGSRPQLSQPQQLNLLPHLGNSYLTGDAEELCATIKHEQANEPEMPQALLTYSESLMRSGKFIRAREELRYLITYYAETRPASVAMGHLRNLHAKFA